MKDNNLVLLKAQYAYGGVCLSLIHKTEGPWATVTTCLPGYTSDEIIALNHDLAEFDSSLVEELIEMLTDGCIGNVQQGFVNFPLYKLKPGILDTVDECY